MRDGWTRTTLRSLVTHTIGGTWGKEPGGSDVDVVSFGTKAYAAGAQFLDASSGTLRSVSSKQYGDRRLLAGDLVLEVSGGSDRQPVGRTLFVATDTPHVIPSSFMRLLRFDQEAVEPRWMRLLMQHLYASGVTARLQSNTTSIRNLNVQALLDVEVDVPPIPKQRRIVDLIVALDDTIAAAEAARRAQALNVRCQRSLVFKARETAPAGDMFDILIGVQRNPARAAGDNQAHYLRSANVGFGVLDLSDIYTMSFSGAERAKYALQTDDVLVSEGSASETAVGAPCRWQGEIGETVCFQNTLLRYRSRPGRTTPAFVDQWCAWAYESGAFREVAGGSNIKHIGARRAELMPVAAIPISEQPDMLAPVEAAAEALRASETHMRSLQALRAAALMALLSGEHEIPESYDELLEVAS